MAAGIKDRLLGICDRYQLFPLFNRFTKNRAAVFMLHHFCADGLRDYRSLPADILDQCLSYLVSNGYKAAALSEFVNGLIEKRSMYKTVVFTVDDGYRDFLEHGFPVFAKYNIPVAVFITTHFIDGKFRFWWDRMREIVQQTELSEIEIGIGGKTISGRLATEQEKEAMLHRIIEQSKHLPETAINKALSDLGRLCGASEFQTKQEALSWNDIMTLAAKGVEFYPHTCAHPILSHCSDAQVRREIVESKETISNFLQKPANIFCYPNGRYDDFDSRSIEELTKAGYLAAFTSEEGFDAPDGAPDMHRLHRFSLSSDLIRFKKIISGLEAMIDRCRKRVC